jgi:hypothetical protein
MLVPYPLFAYSQPNFGWWITGRVGISWTMDSIDMQYLGFDVHREVLLGLHPVTRS